MPLILVAEHESHHVEHIRQILATEGWEVQAVGGADQAVASAERRPPQLVLASSELPGAAQLFSAFSRRTGGPGVIALVPEQATETVEQLGADELIRKPFTARELRATVERGLSSARPAAAPPDKEQDPLTSADIFGDLVAEMEGEIAAERSGGEVSPAAEQEPSTPSSESKPPEPSAPRHRPSGSHRPRTSKQVDQALEETLSGLRDSTKRSGTERSQRRKRKRRPAEGDDVEALLSETLSGLKLPRSRRTRSSTKTRSTPDHRPKPSEEPKPDASQGGAPASRETSSSPEQPATDDTTPAQEEVLKAEPEDEEFPNLFRLEDLPGPDESAAELIGFSGSGASGQDIPESVSESLELDEDLFVPELEPSDPEPTQAPSPPGGSQASGASEPPVAQPPEETGSGSRLPAEKEASPQPEEPGRQFGQYTLLERIAVGGMAEVWKARMKGLEGFQKTVAIKKILSHLTDNTDFVSMFVDEAKLAAQLNHPHIIHIYDLGKIGEHYYIAMEYVEGINLRTLLNEARRKALPIPLGLALMITARLASALDYAHRKKDFEDRELGLVHRDVSPQNVLLSSEGDIKLCDFGIVKAVSKASQTQMGALKGKLQYMSPEQAWGKPVDARSDIFSLGALFFEMLTGERLFGGDSEISVLEAVRQCRVRAPRDLNPDIPVGVQELVLRALEQDPDRRFETAGQMQHEVEALLYDMRPAPSQTDLADYLERLRSAPERPEPDTADPPHQAASSPRPPATAPDEPRTENPPPERSPHEEPVTASPKEEGSTAADPLDEAATSRSLRPEVHQDARDQGIEDHTSEMEAMEPIDEDPVIEEGGSRGRFFLIAIIVLLGILAILAVLFYDRLPGPDNLPGAEPPAREAPADGEPSVDPELPPASDPSSPDGAEPETSTTGVSRSERQSVVQERLGATAHPTATVGSRVEPGADLRPSVLVSIDKPQYSPVARRMRARGTVAVSVLIAGIGRVTEFRLLQGVCESQAILEATRTAPHRPLRKAGHGREPVGDPEDPLHA